MHPRKHRSANKHRRAVQARPMRYFFGPALCAFALYLLVVCPTWEAAICAERGSACAIPRSAEYGRALAFGPEHGLRWVCGLVAGYGAALGLAELGCALLRWCTRRVAPADQC